MATMKPPRLSNSGNEITATSFVSSLTVPFMYTTLLTQSSLSNNSSAQDMISGLSHSSSNKLLHFDHLKIHGHKKELSVLEGAVKSMMPGRKRRTLRAEENAPPQEANYDSSHSTNSTTFSYLHHKDKEWSSAEVSNEGGNNTMTSKTKQKQLILISGYSGTGKSVLAHSIRDLVINEMEGTFVTGKFDQWMKSSTRGDSLRGEGVSAGDHHQRQQQQPYTAFRMICDGLVREVVATKTNTQDSTSRRVFEELKDQLMMELGTELVDLIQVFPSLDGLLSSTGQSQTFGESGHQIDTFTSTQSDLLRRQQKHNIGNVNTESLFRFKFTFGVLFRIIASAISPLVLVIDDLQWADSASLDLLESLLSNREIKNLMVIGSYRSNEVDDDHLFSKTLENIRSASHENNNNGTSIVEMEIGNLDEDAVQEMLSSLLLLPVGDKDRVKSLAEICYKKTGGNPFYLTRFVVRLCEMRMVSYDHDLMDWTWDEQRIELYTDATDNVVDLLKQSMTSLSPEHQTLLRFAAFLGSRFEERPIFVLWKDFHTSNDCVTNESKKKSPSTGSTRNGVGKSKIKSTSLSDCEKTLSSDEVGKTGIRFKEVLKSCQDAGYLERSGGETTYRWVHDKLQEAAIDILDRKERRNFSQYVAEVLTKKLPDQELEPLMFVLVDRFNGGNLPTKRSKCIELAKLNLRAAEKAVSYSAFESAASYCKYGIRLLPKDSWERDYDLSLELYSLGAETEGFLGHVHVMGEYCKEVLRQKEVVVGDGSGGKSRGRLSRVPKSGDGRRGGVRDKFRVYNVMMLSIANRNLQAEALKLCLDVLGEYGVKFPKTTVGVTCRIGMGVMKLKSRLKSLTKEDIENLPMVNDPVRIEQMGLLDKMATYCYMAKSNLYPLVAFKLMDMTLVHGYCKFSPLAFGMGALILCGVLDDLASGPLCAEYALTLLNKLDPTLSREVEARTVIHIYGFAFHWGNPLSTALQPMLRGYEVGMQCGDTESAIFNLLSSIFFSFVCGANLETIERDYRTFSPQMKKLKQDMMLIQNHISWQLVLNLMGRSQFTTRLTGEALKEEVCREEVKTNPVLLDSLNVHKMVLCSFFGDFQNAADYAYKKGDTLQKTLPGLPTVPLYTFHGCLSLLAMARILRQERSENSSFAGRSCNGRLQGMEARYVRSAKKALNKIKYWVGQGNPQSRHYEPLLEAELAAYYGNQEMALEKYEMAVDTATKDEFIQDAALANERYGIYLLSRCDEAPDGLSISTDVINDVEEGRIQETASSSKNERRMQGLLRLEGSVRCYREWGGHGKADTLEKKYRSLFETRNDLKFKCSAKADL